MHETKVAVFSIIYIFCIQQFSLGNRENPFSPVFNPTSHTLLSPYTSLLFPEINVKITIFCLFSDYAATSWCSLSGAVAQMSLKTCTSSEETSELESIKPVCSRTWRRCIHICTNHDNRKMMLDQNIVAQIRSLQQRHRDYS